MRLFYKRIKWRRPQFKVEKSRLALFLFRALSMALAAGLLLRDPQLAQSPRVMLLLGLVGAYSVVKILIPFRWYKQDTLTYLVFGADIAICAVIVLFTGGLGSAFLVYAINPILVAALLLKRRTAITSAAAACIAVVAAHLISPNTSFLSIPLTALPGGYVSALVLFIAVCFLVAYLPYIVNINAHHTIEEKATADERRRLARELHDNLAQNLGYLKMKAHLLKEMVLNREIEPAVAELGDVKLIVDDLYCDLRESIGLLRLGSLDKVGLMASLADSVHQFSQRTGIKTEIYVADGESKFSDLTELHLLSLIHEALNNVRKHAGASKVRVRFVADKKYAELRVKDNGCGFDTVEYFGSEKDSEHIGLKVMKERVQLLGGSMTISSKRGKGTEILFRVPLGQGVPHQWTQI